MSLFGEALGVGEAALSSSVCAWRAPVCFGAIEGAVCIGDRLANFSDTPSCKVRIIPPVISWCFDLEEETGLNTI